MARPPRKKLPAFEPFSQRKTLFLESPGIAGILVESVKGKHRKRALKFRDAHAALDWCIKQSAGLVFYFNNDPSKN
jgi:hypothetical protein